MPSKLGALVAAAREAKGLKLRELARRIDRSPSFVSMLENDESAPSMKEETIVALAEELSLSVDHLLALAGRVPEEAIPDSEVEVALFRRVKELPTDKKEQLLRQLRGDTAKD